MNARLILLAQALHYPNSPLPASWCICRCISVMVLYTAKHMLPSIPDVPPRLRRQFLHLYIYIKIHIHIYNYILEHPNFRRYQTHRGATEQGSYFFNTLQGPLCMMGTSVQTLHDISLGYMLITCKSLQLEKDKTDSLLSVL